MRASTWTRGLICAVAFALAAVAINTADLRAYALLGKKWATNQVLYYVNPQNNYMASSYVVAAVQNAATAWTAQTSANIQLIYAGTTNGGSFTMNNKNEFFFRNDSSSPAGETYWWSDASGKIVDADVALNQGRYPFSADGVPCSTGIDVQNITTHEFGHALGLLHSGVGDATMYPTMAAWCDTSWRTLSADDIAGIQALYPGGGGAPNAPTAPASLTVSRNPADAKGSLLLSWSDRSNNESGFKVERSVDGWSFSQVASLGVNSGSYTDSGLSWGALYYYRVSAFNSTGTSGYSNTASAVTEGGAAVAPAGTSPDGAMVPTVAQIVDGQGAVWTIGSGGAILRNGVSAAGGLGSKILWSGGVVYVLGTDSAWYRWTGSVWIKDGASQAPASGVSPDGTQVPGASQIVDSQGAVWTIGGGGAILRNGVSAAGGLGSKILWSGGVVYVFGTDSAWYQWTGSWWMKVGASQAPAPSVSPDGTQVPGASQIVDSQGAAWTIGSGGAILRNGVSAAGGLGSKILWSGGVVYVFGTNSAWYRWTGSSWINVGANQPGASSPDGTQVPGASQIVDSQGAVWTIGSGGAILRNGASAAGGYGSSILWSGGVIYVYGTTSTWYRWTGSGWINLG